MKSGIDGIVVFGENFKWKSRFFFGLGWSKKKKSDIFLMSGEKVNFSPGLKFIEVKKCVFHGFNKIYCIYILGLNII